MRIRTWAIVALAMAGLLLLLAASLLATRQRAQGIYAQLDQINRRQREIDGTLRRLRSDVNLSGIFVRDYLLDTAAGAGAEYRARLSDMRAQTHENLAALDALLGPADAARVESLKSKIDDYWQVFDPLFDWTPAEKGARRLPFLRHEVLPRRDEVLRIAREIEDLNEANTREQRAEVAMREEELRAHLDRILWGSLALGGLVAAAATARIVVLESRSRLQHERTRRAEDEMRGLSRRLVSAQEDERRRLARELHDEVGQMLTALRMEVGRLERLRSADGATFAASAADCKRIVERVMESVRGLSMGLRPSMLDDLGLGAALDWQARDFSRRYELPVFLEVQGDVDGLPEPHRTCVYRVFQEALTNCAKHAQARRIEVSVRAAGGRLRLCVTDDGVGWDPRPGASGMGLVGIEERVREIQGTVAVDSRPGQGTTVSVEIPSPRQGEERHESAAR